MLDIQLGMFYLTLILGIHIEEQINLSHDNKFTIKYIDRNIIKKLIMNMNISKIFLSNIILWKERTLTV